MPRQQRAPLWPRWHRGLLVSVALAVFTERVDGGCVDEDDQMGQIMLQQAGQALTCRDVVLGGGRVKVCDDPLIGDELCCASCAVLQARFHADRAEELRQYEAPIARMQGLLAGPAGNARLRSAPLHGLGSGMPLLTMGTGGLRGLEGSDVMEVALRIGYRHLDSAIMYENHGALAGALNRSGVPREDVFVTTKVPPEMMGFTSASAAVAKIRSELPGGYADLCLVHWPFARMAGEDSEAGAARSAEWQVVERAGTWRALEEAFDEGTCRALGVSNYMLKHLQELRMYARVQPSVNQLELSPLAPHADLIEYCREQDIVLMGFGWRRKEVLEHPTVRAVASELGRPAAQVVNRWFLQQGWAPLYTSSRVERILEHAEVIASDFSLSEAQMARISEHALANYPWRYYKGRYEPKPWTIPVMSETTYRSL